MSEVDDQIERSRAMMHRIASDYRDEWRVRSDQRRKRFRRSAKSMARKSAHIGIANAAILIAAVVIGLMIPLGIFGGLAVLFLMIAATLLIAMAPAARAPTEQKLREVDIKALPAQTERWLEAQRPALPAPAKTLLDRIGGRLETLSPQLGRLEGQEEAAYDVRRLIGEQLPAFVTDYAKVPTALRGVERNGKTPDGELIDGLKLIEREIADMTARLAQADLDSLSTRGRFLEMKYKDGSEA